jgi:hypothetical protein
MAFSLFVNAAKGISSLQLSRCLGLQAKTAFVLLHKLRCALTANFATTRLNGVVEIDGGWFGGHVRPVNHRVSRDRRRRQSGKRRCVVVMRQRAGPTVTAVVKHETEAVPIIRRRVARGSTVHADEARAWDDLHASFEMKRINHREAHSKVAPARTSRKATSRGCDARRLVSITVSPGLISASMPTKWRGTKTCATTPPEANSVPVAAWLWAIRPHVRRRDIGSGIAGRRNFAKQPDRRSARGRNLARLLASADTTGLSPYPSPISERSR